VKIEQSLFEAGKGVKSIGYFGASPPKISEKL